VRVGERAGLSVVRGDSGNDVRQNVDQDRTAPHRNAAEDLGQTVLTTRRRDGVEQEGDLTTTCDNQNRNFTYSSLPSPRPSRVGGEGTLISLVSSSFLHPWSCSVIRGIHSFRPSVIRGPALSSVGSPPSFRPSVRHPWSCPAIRGLPFPRCRGGRAWSFSNGCVILEGVDYYRRRSM
jgi:hypothetical protein